MKTVSINWQTEDVLGVRPDLTEQQADKVLDQLVRGHDATIGINWDVIRATAGDLFPRVIRAGRSVNNEAHKIPNASRG